MRKKICILISLLMFLVAINVYAKDTIIAVEYFGTDTCATCLRAKKAMKQTIIDLEKEGVRVIVNDYNTLEEEQKRLFETYLLSYNVPEHLQKVIPTIFIGEMFFVGEKEIADNFKGTIMEYYNYPQAYMKPVLLNNYGISSLQKAKDLVTSFPVVAVFTAGLLDGFNPCSIAMLLFFVSFLFSTGKKRYEVLWVGILFILGTFLAYLLIGAGLFSLGYTFKGVKSIVLLIYGATILLSLFLMFFNIKDFISIKKGNYKNIKTQLPKGIKHRIHNIIRKTSQSKAIYVTAFLSAFIISFLEFFCTGQIYLPTISYVLSSGSMPLRAYSLLIIYNLAFVLPLIIITLLVFYGKEVLDISQILVDKLHIIKLVGAIFFLLITILMTFQLLSII